MMLRLAACALLLILPSAVHAQEPTTLEIAALVCVGPGFIPDGDPFDILDDLPEKYCVKACKAARKGCRGVVKAIDKCGVRFLKSSAKSAIAICRGWGYTKQECRPIKDEAKLDIGWWREQGKIERGVCDSDTQTFCLSRCY